MSWHAADPTALQPPWDWSKDITTTLRFRNPEEEEKFHLYRRNKATLLSFRGPIFAAAVIWLIFITQDVKPEIPKLNQIILIVSRSILSFVVFIHLIVATCVPRVGNRPSWELSAYACVVMGIHLGLENVLAPSEINATVPLGLTVVMYAAGGICGFKVIQMALLGLFQIVVYIATTWIAYPNIGVDIIPTIFTLGATWVLVVAAAVDLDLRDRFHFTLSRQSRFQNMSWQDLNSPQRMMMNNIDNMEMSMSMSLDAVKAIQLQTMQQEQQQRERAAQAAALEAGPSLASSGPSLASSGPSLRSSASRVGMNEMKHIRCWMSFVKPKLERGFTAFTIRETWRGLWRAMVLAVLGECIFAIQDYIALRDEIEMLLTLRFGFTIPILICGAAVGAYQRLRTRAHIFIPILAFLNGVAKVLVLFLLPSTVSVTNLLIFVVAVIRYMLFGAFVYKLRYAMLALILLPICAATVLIMIFRHASMTLAVFPVGSFIVAVVIAYVNERHSRVLYLLETASKRSGLRAMAAAGAALAPTPGLGLPRPAVLLEEDEGVPPPSDPVSAWMERSLGTAQKYMAVDATSRPVTPPSQTASPRAPRANGAGADADDGPQELVDASGAPVILNVIPEPVDMVEPVRIASPQLSRQSSVGDGAPLFRRKP